MKKSVYAVVVYCLIYATLIVMLSMGWANGLANMLDTIANQISPSLLLARGIMLQNAILLFLLLATFSSIVYKTHSLQQNREYIHSKWKWKGWSFLWHYSIGWLAIYLLINALLSLFVTKFAIQIPGLYGQQSAISLIQGIAMHSRRDFGIVWLTVVALGPIVEEVIYRWYITQVLVDQYRRAWSIVSAIIFACSHGERTVVINLFILSLFLNYIYTKTWSLYYSLAFHMLINWLAFVALSSMSMW